jgi:nitrogen fixation protein FixH
LKRGAGWPIAVASILVACVAANAWVVRLATNDPAFAVEENYYQRALHWDDELAQRRVNAALGWRLSTSVSRIVPDSGARLHVELRDSAGAPIPDALVRVRALHNARAGEPLAGQLVAEGGGSYGLRLPMRRPGLWELRFDVHRGAEHFTAGSRIEAVLTAPD